MMDYPKEDRIRDATIEMRSVFGECHYAIEAVRLNMFIYAGFSFVEQKDTEAKMPEMFKLLTEALIAEAEEEEKKPASVAVEGFVAKLKGVCCE